MPYDVAGLGNALMDALVVLDRASETLEALGLVRGTMRLVDHAGWQEALASVERFGVVYETGGSCANTIATLGHLGASAVYCGQVGDDALGKRYQDRMRDATGHQALSTSATFATGKCLSIIDAADGERTMLTDLGAAVALDDLSPFHEAMKTSKIAYFEGYTLLDGPMAPLVEAAMHHAKALGVRVALDASDPFVVAGIKDRLWRLIEQYVDILFVNAEEARALTDSAPEHAAGIIATRGRVDTVIVKLGARGSILRRGDEEHRIEADRVEAIDTTGAGDAYAAGMLYGLTHDGSLTQSGRLAAFVAALAVSQVGAVVTDRAKLAQARKRAFEG